MTRLLLVWKRNDLRLTERSDNLTPSGGDFSIAYYYDEDGIPCEKSQADFVNIVQYKKAGIRLNEHYGLLDRKGKKANKKKRE